MLSLDHIVVVAPSVTEGVSYVRDLTGIDMPKGGEHPVMGTHNHLIRLGKDEFLEVIAVNPDSPPPSRPRWFGLDQPVKSPRLAHWVLRTDDISGIRPRLPDVLGPAIPLTRGDLAWHLTVPEDGSLPYDGAAPSLLKWANDPLPPTQMKGAGAALTTLTITHPMADELQRSYAPHLSDPRINWQTGPFKITAGLTIGRETRSLY